MKNIQTEHNICLKFQLLGGKAVGHLQSVVLGLKTGLLWNKSKWSERDSNLGPLAPKPLGHDAFPYVYSFRLFITLSCAVL